MVNPFLLPMRLALGHNDEGAVTFQGHGGLASAFAVTDLAAAAVAAAGLEVAGLLGTIDEHKPHVTVDRRLASHWFSRSVRPLGWSLPPPWDALAGDYPTRDGWIKLHTNAERHRAAALAVLSVRADRAQIAQAVSQWRADELETAVAQAGGCAAEMRSTQAWHAHPQGMCVQAEPLIDVQNEISAPLRTAWQPTAEQPLNGLRVLDLTRVLAGPVATRFLAGYGANVLRIDPPAWDEPSLAPEVTVGKRCARLDLQQTKDLDRLEALLRDADVLIHGFRTGALDALGLDAAKRRAIQPALIDVSLNAYGHTGPWCRRRGFDSLVQMSSGIAHAGMVAFGAPEPVPLPMQALDHATGYLMAAAAVQGVHRRLLNGAGCSARLSLARTAHVLVQGPPGQRDNPVSGVTSQDFGESIERTAWGDVQRLRPPLVVDGAIHRWRCPAGPLGASTATW